MTIEEKAKAYAVEAFTKALKEPWNEAKQAFAETYLAGAEEALRSQWRPFSQNCSPDIGKELLIFGETGDVMLAQIIERPVKPFGHTLVWHPEVKCKVTHWMAITKPGER